MERVRTDAMENSIIGAINEYFLEFLVDSILRLPGPKPDNLLFGNLIATLNSESDLIHEEWHKKYGPVVSYQTFMGDTRLSFCDAKALSHVLNNRPYDYPKPGEVKGDTRMILTNGLAFAEGEIHRRQRRLLNSTFSVAQVKATTSLIYSKAIELREQWIKHVEENRGHSSAKQENKAIIDITDAMARASLDIIGQVAFDQDFNTLKSDANHLGKTFSEVFGLGLGTINSIKLIGFMILGKFPNLLKIIDKERYELIKNGLKNVERESQKALEKKKAEMMVEKMAGKDFIGALVKANLATEDKNRMSDVEVMGQMTTFLLGGHETTSNAMNWALWLLAKNQSVQKKLREEILSAQATHMGEELSIEELNRLPYLDAVCRECLRLFPPISMTIRMAREADNIPLSAPVRVKNRFGSGTILMDHIPVEAGQRIIIPISSYNRSEENFGTDSSKFIPERWLKQESNSKKNSTAWSGLMTFLGGARSCIGYRLALAEIKILMNVLISGLHFEERDELGGPEIERRMALAVRPRIKGFTDGTQLPLKVSLVI
ncbi:cytochrome P450 monooxygenase [Phakopsora pachyrhizi]|nr:cytochrome P450 monooxygenase [Phakopsora pachyrhizi]KAI8450155.1 cytochrome P450 monooxygenase [Phakopsora pachyrhizi]